MHIKWIKFDALIGIIASILIILLAIYVTPDYVVKNLSPDGILEPPNINRVNIIRVVAAVTGLLMFISSITFKISPNLLYCVLTWIQKHVLIILIILPISALIIRFGAFIIFCELTGDGPTRAIQAYNWSKSPFFLTHGVWLPGFIYLSGIFTYLINNPLISVRILNMILGSLTILFFYLLVRSIYDKFIAILSSSILTVLPLHIGLSVTSLTEVSFIYEFIAGTYFLILASENHSNKKLIHLFVSLVMLCLSTMTRYESWILIPLFPCYYFWKTKRKFESTIILLILIVCPVLWMVGNYHHTGSLLPGFSAALQATEQGPKPESLARALLRLGSLSRAHMFWVLPIISVFGFFFNLILAIKKRLNAKQLLYFLIACFTYIFIIKFTMDRGKTLWSRYLLFSMILALPFAAYTIRMLFYNLNRLIVIFIVLGLILSPIASQLIYQKNLYLLKSHSPDIIDLAVWLKSSKYHDVYVLSTKLNWDASLLPLYFPEISRKHFIVSGWASDQGIQKFLNNKPSLLVFRQGDEKYKLRIEKIIGKKVMKEDLIKKIGKLHIYEIKNILN
jgi:hypothetical protein